MANSAKKQVAEQTVAQAAAATDARVATGNTYRKPLPVPGMKASKRGASGSNATVGFDLDAVQRWTDKGKTLPPQLEWVVIGYTYYLNDNGLDNKTVISARDLSLYMIRERYVYDTSVKMHGTKSLVNDFNIEGISSVRRTDDKEEFVWTNMQSKATFTYTQDIHKCFVSSTAANELIIK